MSFQEGNQVYKFRSKQETHGVHSVFLLYLSSPFLKKVLYEIKEILLICVTPEITREK